MNKKIGKEKVKVIWLILVAAGCVLTIVFGTLFAQTIYMKHAKGNFPVDVSALSVSKICGTKGRYVVGTEDGSVLYYDEKDSEIPFWTYKREAAEDGSFASVADIVVHGEDVYVAYSDRYVYSFSLVGGEENPVKNVYQVGLTPQSMYFDGDSNLFAVYGATAAHKGLYIFDVTEESDEVISYRDHAYLDNNNGLGDGLTCAVIANDNTLYFATETSKIIRVTLDGWQISDEGVESVYEGVNDFLAIMKTETGYAAMDKFTDVYLFDEEMKNAVVNSGNGVSVTSAFASGDVFVAKVKNGGILGVDIEKGKVFSVSSGRDSLIVFVSEEGFAYLTEDGGRIDYLTTDLAVAKEKAERLYPVWLGLAVVFLLFTVYAALCVFLKTRRKVNGAFAKFGKAAYKHRVAYLSLVPTFLLLAVFYWYPIVSSLVLSFFDYLPKEKMIFVGLNNLVSVAKNTEFWLSFKNTLIFLVADILKAIIPPVLFAEFLLSLKSEKTSYWIRTLMFLPGVIPGVASMLVWADGIFGPSSSGLLNGFLNLIVPSFASKAWLMDKTYALTCLIAIGFPWVGSYLIFFGAISGLPKEMFEAAKLDGCGWWKKVFSFDIPLIVPQIKYIFITTFIGSVQNYTLIYVTTGGDYGTNTPALMMYKAITVQKNYGIASAMGLFLFIFLIGATAVNFKMQFGRSED